MGGFVTAILVISPEREMAERTSMKIDYSNMLQEQPPETAEGFLKNKKDKKIGWQKDDQHLLEELLHCHLWPITMVLRKPKRLQRLEGCHCSHLFGQCYLLW